MAKIDIRGALNWGLAAVVLFAISPSILAEPTQRFSSAGRCVTEPMTGSFRGTISWEGGASSNATFVLSNDSSAARYGELLLYVPCAKQSTHEETADDGDETVDALVWVQYRQRRITYYSSGVANDGSYGWADQFYFDYSSDFSTITLTGQAVEQGASGEWGEVTGTLYRVTQ